MSTSEPIETKITTLVRYLIFHQEDSVRNPQTLALANLRHETLDFQTLANLA